MIRRELLKLFMALPLVKCAKVESVPDQPRQIQQKEDVWLCKGVVEAQSEDIVSWGIEIEFEPSWVQMYEYNKYGEIIKDVELRMENGRYRFDDKSDRGQMNDDILRYIPSASTLDCRWLIRKGHRLFWVATA